MTAFLSNTNVLDLIGLKHAIENTFINDASVTVTITDEAGVPVVGQTWPATMAYLAGSDGNYRAFINASVVFIARDNYYAQISATDTSSRVGFWKYLFKPQDRVK